MQLAAVAARLQRPEAPAVGVPPQPPCCAALALQQRAQLPRRSRQRHHQLSRPLGQRQRQRPGTTVAPARALALPGLAEQAPEFSYLQLAAPEGGAAIHLFGVIHGGNESEVAEFVMRERPEVGAALRAPARCRCG